MSKEHALAILEWEGMQNWCDIQGTQRPGKHGEKFHAITPKFLYHLIEESQTLGGDVLLQFWERLGACHEKLGKNVESLSEKKFVSAEKSLEALFRDLDPKRIDFAPLLDMAAEFFTDLCVAFMNPGGSESGSGTTPSVGGSIDNETDTLLEEPDKKGDFGEREPFLNLELAFKRDGTSCLLTGRLFSPFDEFGVSPALAHIIPNAVRREADVLGSIAVFAGTTARDIVMEHLNDLDNVVNLELNAHSSYNSLQWGIEAIEEEGKTAKYIFRVVSTNPSRARSPGYITLKDGDEIRFGRGPDGEKLGNGPNPTLCNLRLAVARLVTMSGAADIIMKWKDEADDSECHHLFLASEEFLDMLDAKLLLSGRATLAN